jgi:excisionase family DNA binding protein
MIRMRARRSAPKANKVQELLSQQQAAVRLGIHVTTFRGWVREGRIPAYRVGQRFTRVDWNEVLAAIATSAPSSPTEAVTDQRSDASASASRG